MSDTTATDSPIRMSHSQPPQEVTIVIRTALSKRRGDLIRRAVASILFQEGVRARPLMLANGAGCDPELFAEFSSRKDVDFTYVERVSLSDALVLGRELVQSPYFGFLDDDDYYLPGALSRRVARMEEVDRPDVVVSGGIRMLGKEQVPSGAAIHEARQGRVPALRALFDNAWLTSASGLFRSTSVQESFFAGAPRYHEWTFLAGRMILELDVVFINEPGYFLNDSGGSESKSFAYDLGAVDALARMLSLQLPEEIRTLVERKLSAAQHFASLRCLDQGDRRRAWRFHLDSLRGPGGLRYLSYTRHLLFPAMRGQR